MYSITLREEILCTSQYTVEPLLTFFTTLARFTLELTKVIKYSDGKQRFLVVTPDVVL